MCWRLPERHTLEEWTYALLLEYILVAGLWKLQKTRNTALKVALMTILIPGDSGEMKDHG